MPQPAGFWRRLAAQLIDSIIIGLAIVLPFALLMGGMQKLAGNPMYNYIATPCSIAYYVFFLSSRYQATPGKRVMRVYITMAEDHTRLTPWRALGRYAAYTGPGILFILMPLFLSPSDMSASIPTAADQQRMVTIQDNIKHIRKISDDDKLFMQHQQENAQKLLSSPTFKSMISLSLLMFVYMIILAFTVGLTREKTGIHDMMCKTRALVGRPG